MGPMEKLKKFLWKQNYLKHGECVEIIPKETMIEMKEVEGFNEIKYEVFGEYFIFYYPETLKNEALYLITYYTLLKNILKKKKKNINTSDEISLFWELYSINPKNCKIFTDKETIIYIHDSIAFKIDPNYHDNYFLDLALKKLKN